MLMEMNRKITKESMQIKPSNEEVETKSDNEKWTEIIIE